MAVCVPMIKEMMGIKFKLRDMDQNILVEAFEENPYKIENIERGGLVVDLGAHIGTFSLRCAVERDCRVLAFEPCPSTYEILVENVAINGLEGKVIPFKLAIGGTVGRRRLYSVVDAPTASSLYPHWDLAEEEQYVQCVTLKKIFEDNDISTCVALKVDCEEAEREIFTEESKPYFNRTKQVMLEWHYYDGHVYDAYLKGLGFTTLLTGCGNPPPPYHNSFGRGMLYGWINWENFPIFNSKV